MQRQKRYHSINAIVETSFNEGICPDLLNVVERSQLRDEHASTSTAAESPITIERHHSFSLYSSEPESLDSPDGVFTNSRFPKLGFFAAFPRRCSAPVNARRDSSDPCITECRRVGKRSAFSPSPVRIIISISGEESSADLRKTSREFGSAGDLLEEPRPLSSSSYRKYLGKSLQQVSANSYH